MKRKDLPKSIGTLRELILRQANLTCCFCQEQTRHLIDIHHTINRYFEYQIEMRDLAKGKRNSQR